jgi:hypothetical protein
MRARGRGCPCVRTACAIADHGRPARYEPNHGGCGNGQRTGPRDRAIDDHVHRDGHWHQHRRTGGERDGQPDCACDGDEATQGVPASDCRRLHAARGRGDHVVSLGRGLECRDMDERHRGRRHLELGQLHGCGHLHRERNGMLDVRAGVHPRPEDIAAAVRHSLVNRDMEAGLRSWTQCVVLCGFVSMASTAAAQQSPGLSFQATLESIKITAQPGQVVTRQFRLTLDANQPPTRFRARVEDWWRSEDGQQTFYRPAGTLQRSCAEWVSLNPVESTVAPGETLTLRLSVAIPLEVRPGGFWCALTVDEVPNPLAAPQEGVGVRFTASVSTGIFVYLDPVQRVASIQDVQVTGDQVQVRVRNDGNAPLGIEGKVEFLTPGAQTPTATVVLARTTVLTEPSPAGVVTTVIPSEDVLPAGVYRTRVILDFGADHYIGAEREVTIRRLSETRVVVP